METNHIDNLDIVQLQALKLHADELIEKKQKEQLDDAYEQLLEIASSVGLSLEALIEHGQNKKTVNKRTVEPRYKNPDDAEQTWTGRGKKPRWVMDQLEKGKTLDDLLI